MHHNSPYNSESKRSENMARVEDSPITVHAPYLEVIAILKTMVIMTRIQLWRVLVPFFPARVRVVTTFYAKIDLVNHNESFSWETNFPKKSTHDHLEIIFYTRQELFRNLQRLKEKRNKKAKRQRRQ